MVRAAGCGRVDDRRRVRDTLRRPRVDPRRNDGQDAALDSGVTGNGSGARCVGSREPPSRGRPANRRAGCDHPARVRRVYADPHRRRPRRHPAALVALDADGGGASAGTGRAGTRCRRAFRAGDSGTRDAEDGGHVHGTGRAFRHQSHERGAGGEGRRYSRGAARDSIIRGLSIETDWAKSPPVAVWRRPIGPGWSSFAVAGDLVYTQEQRGNDEIVSAYSLTTGAPIWRHRDTARFYESNGGPGPRGTPTFSNGRLYAVGATGIVNALDATSGAVLWSRNAVTD